MLTFNTLYYQCQTVFGGDILHGLYCNLKLTVLQDQTTLDHIQLRRNLYTCCRQGIKSCKLYMKKINSIMILCVAMCVCAWKLRFLEFCYVNADSEDDQYRHWSFGLVSVPFSRLSIDGTAVWKFVGFDFCEELCFDIWIYYTFRMYWLFNI